MRSVRFSHGFHIDTCCAHGLRGITTTQPNPVLLAAGPTFLGEAGITGQAVQGSTVSESVNTSNVQVTVAGTSITTWTDSRGRFRLVNVPSGNVILQFSSNEVNAKLTVPGVGATQQVAIQVQLESSSATIVADERSELQKFNSVVTSVVQVDGFNGTVGLVDGTMVVVDEFTWWDTGGDYFNLADLENAVLEGKRVEAKGQGTPDELTGQILASVIRAKLAEDEFEGTVDSASGTDPEGTIILLTNEKGSITEVHVDATTAWDAGRDITNLTDLLTAVNTDQLKVNVEGEGTLDVTGTFILADKIKAEFVEAEFEGIVGSANGIDPNGTILLLANEKGSITEVRVNADTLWEGDEISSLTALLAALGGPNPVKVEGEGICGVNKTFILATSIKAEIEEEDNENACGDLFAAEITAIEELISLVRSVAVTNGLNGGQTNSLVSKLENTIKSLQKCNTNPAVNRLGAFINEVEAYVGSGKLTAADGSDLIAAAQAIIDAINAAG